MKVYTVIENTSYGSKPIKTFSSFAKALKEIENICGEITAIVAPDVKRPLSDVWYHKEYYSTVDWAKILLNKRFINCARYGNPCGCYLLTSYTIKAVEVF